MQIKITVYNFRNESFDGKCQNLQKTSPHFCGSSYRFCDIKIFNCLSSKSRSSSPRTIFALSLLDIKCYNQQKSSANFFLQLIPFRQYYDFTFFTFKKQVKVTEHNCRCDIFDDKYRNLQMTPKHFCASSHLFIIYILYF